ncbi:hypothetical protein GALMADRAFT_515672 [Galerina marginata CBS 339.88]|uniref:Uncharacterized protein n=1 Tax=Galerina marginata (strain CBS 339.88) TaxID=685588 RepID=A0A067SYB7_GALM3|nr:hypothetical protein GALMADRAFT_515672 [Galerina marginata CBS 339.88]
MSTSLCCSSCGYGAQTIYTCHSRPRTCLLSLARLRSGPRLPCRTPVPVGAGPTPVSLPCLLPPVTFSPDRMTQRSPMLALNDRIPPSHWPSACYATALAALLRFLRSLILLILGLSPHLDLTFSIRTTKQWLHTYKIKTRPYTSRSNTESSQFIHT